MSRIIIPGKPLPLKRPRLSKWGVYDAQKAEKRHFAESIKTYMREHNMSVLSGPISLRVWFYMQFPESWNGKKRRRVIECGNHHTTVPDTSNLIKFVEDALNGILWEDDSMICDITATKHYAETPYTVIHANPIPLPPGEHHV